MSFHFHEWKFYFFSLEVDIHWVLHQKLEIHEILSARVFSANFFAKAEKNEVFLVLHLCLKI